MKLIAPILALLLLALPAQAAEVVVARVVDGDSGTFDGGVGYRLAGVDTPERGKALAAEATERARGLVQGRRVRVALDPLGDMFDRYGRLICYIYFSEGKAEVCLNERLVLEGLARTTAFPCQQAARFRSLQQRAKQASRGIWGP